MVGRLQADIILIELAQPCEMLQNIIQLPKSVILIKVFSIPRPKISAFIQNLKYHAINEQENASPWQNDHQESFYSGFKLELGHPECYPTLEELIEAVARQIHDY